MELKIQRDIYILTEEDRILFNGSVYILTTRTKSEGFRKVSPSVSTARMKKLIKDGDMIEVFSELSYITEGGKEMWKRIYKPNMK